MTTDFENVAIRVRRRRGHQAARPGSGCGAGTRRVAPGYEYDKLLEEHSSIRGSICNGDDSEAIQGQPVDVGKGSR
jgi:hypothetical protein